MHAYHPAVYLFAFDFAFSFYFYFSAAAAVDGDVYSLFFARNQFQFVYLLSIFVDGGAMLKERVLMAQILSLRFNAE